MLTEIWIGFIVSKLLFTLMIIFWQWRVDIGMGLKVLEQIETTTQQPDSILWSTETRQVAPIELTVSWEENIEVACERKLEKYQELVEQ